jgi:hypothetical protein
VSSLSCFQVIDSTRKENFSLKLKIHFLEERLAQLAPDQVDLALKENIELKVEFQTVRQELKRYKKLLIETEGAVEDLKKERFARGGSSVRERELEAEIRTMKQECERERRRWEAALAEREAEARQARERERKNEAGDPEGEDARVRCSLSCGLSPPWLYLSFCDRRKLRVYGRSSMSNATITRTFLLVRTSLLRNLRPRKPRSKTARLRSTRRRPSAPLLRRSFSLRPKTSRRSASFVPLHRRLVYHYLHQCIWAARAANL